MNKFDESLESKVNKHINYYNGLPNVSSDEDYDSLYEIVKEDLKDYLLKDIKQKFQYLNKDLKQKYELELDEDNLYYSLEMNPNKANSNSYNKKGEEFTERWGLPIKIKNSSEVDEFYLLYEGYKITHDENGKSYLFKEYSNDCLEDFIENGPEMEKDICQITSKYTTPL
ncbi:MAG: hypothetical protein ACOCRX_01125 [Candidatus Woesearchaeota archaeon]